MVADLIPLAAIYFAMSLPVNAPLPWWGPLTKAQCERIERASPGSWCYAIPKRSVRLE